MNLPHRPLLALALLGALTALALKRTRAVAPTPLPAPSSAGAEISQRELLQKRREIKAKFPKFRRKFWEMQRSYPLGRIPDGAYRRAEVTHRKLTPRVWGSPLSTHDDGVPSWEPRGPSPANVATSGLTGLNTSSGRATAVAIDPSKPSTIYLGTAQGGVWKSIDSGASWTPLTDDQPSLAIGFLFLDPGAPETIYVGTGEGHGGSISYAGRGLLKSTDGGKTWTRPAGERFTGVSIIKIAASKDGKRLYLGTTFDAAGVGYCNNTYFDKPDQGLFASDDGGATWQLLFSGSIADFELDTSGPASVLYLAPYKQGVWRLVDDGSAPVKLPFPDETTTPAAARVELALAPSDPKVLYASPSLLVDGLARGSLYLSKDGGESWAEIPGAPDHCLEQCDYDNAVAVHPQDPGTVYFGGSLCAVWKLTGGLSPEPVFSPVSLPGKQCDAPESIWFEGSVHPDLHAIAFAPDNPEIVYVASDGGFGVSKDGGATWTSPNEGLATLQFYSACLHPTNPKILLGGTQDNGYLLTDGSPTWTGFITGDGIGCSVLSSGNTALFTILGGLVLRTKFKGSFVDSSSFSVVFDPTCNSPAADGCGEFSAYFPVLTQDPGNPDALYLGSRRLLRSTEGGAAGTWKPISDDLTRGSQGLACSYHAFDYLSQDILTGISLHPGGKAIATVSAGGAVATSLDGAATWQVHTDGLPTRYGSGIALDAADPSTLYASFSGFSEATPTTPGHVFRSTDGGTSWTGLEPGGVDIPVNSLVAHPTSSGVLFVGTDLGVLASYDSGKTWSPPATGLPTTAVHWLGYHAASSQLVAATYGRSAWSVTFPPGFAAAPAALSFSSGDPGPKPVTLSNPGHPASLQTVQAKADVPWIKLPSPSFRVGALQPVALPVSVDPAGLPLGLHTGALTLQPSLGGEPATVAVTLQVTEGTGGAAGSGGAAGGQSGAGGSGNSGQPGAGAAGKVLEDPLPANGPLSAEGGGCGCRVVSPGSAGWLGGLALLGALGAGRRRREEGAKTYRSGWGVRRWVGRCWWRYRSPWWWWSGARFCRW
jgi:MYXO-CTERM domain-containing protein